MKNTHRIEVCYVYLTATPDTFCMQGLTRKILLLSVAGSDHLTCEQYTRFMFSKDKHLQ